MALNSCSPVAKEEAQNANWEGWCIVRVSCLFSICRLASSPFYSQVIAISNKLLVWKNSNVGGVFSLSFFFFQGQVLASVEAVANE